MFLSAASLIAFVVTSAPALLAVIVAAVSTGIMHRHAPASKDLIRVPFVGVNAATGLKPQSAFDVERT